MVWNFKILTVEWVLNVFKSQRNENEEIIIFMLGCNYLSIINCLWYTRNILFLKILYSMPKNDYDGVHVAKNKFSKHVAKNN